MSRRPVIPGSPRAPTRSRRLAKAVENTKLAYGFERLDPRSLNVSLKIPGGAVDDMLVVVYSMVADGQAVRRGVRRG
jgi:hypothetical protein